MYYFYSLLTAPGVVIHELGHVVFCVLAGVKIHEIKLFRFGNPAGYVIHDEPRQFVRAVLVSFGPLIVNTLVSLFCFARFSPILTLTNILYLWLGIASALHAIPSTGDAKSLLATTNSRILRNPLILIGYPFVILIYTLNLLKRIHLHVLFAALLFWLGNHFLKQ